MAPRSRATMAAPRSARLEQARPQRQGRGRSPVQQQWRRKTSSTTSNAQPTTTERQPCGPAYRVRSEKQLLESQQPQLGGSGSHQPPDDKAAKVPSSSTVCVSITLGAAAEVQPPIPDDVALEWALQLSQEASGSQMEGGGAKEKQSCIEDEKQEKAHWQEEVLDEADISTCCKQKQLQRNSRSRRRCDTNGTLSGASTAASVSGPEDLSEASPAGARASPIEEQPTDEGDSTVDNPGTISGGRRWRAHRDPRLRIARVVFRECDIDGDGRLGPCELRHFAVETGFDGTAQDWAEEYEALCEERDVDPALGFHEADFLGFVEDDSDEGCHCGEDELREVCARLEATRLWRQSLGRRRSSGSTASSNKISRPSRTDEEGEEENEEEDTASVISLRPQDDVHEDLEPRLQDLSTACWLNSERDDGAGNCGASLSASVNANEQYAGGGSSYDDDAQPPMFDTLEPQWTQEQHMEALDRRVQARLKEVLRSPEDEAEVEECLRALKATLRKRLPDGEQWQMSAFGSIMNGFGTRGCDLDIVATRKVGKNNGSKAAAPHHVLATLAEHMKGSSFTVSQAILQARVPILKLQYHENQEIDLSINNTLAVKNSALLREYSSLDLVVAHLGIAVKLWAKDGQICGASSGHLSSYAFTLMAIYFLQVACEPALPCLQAEEAVLSSIGQHSLEDEAADDGGNSPRTTAPSASGSGESSSSVGSRRPSWKPGKSVGALLMDFFEFYASKFRWGSEVISVRMGQRLDINATATDCNNIGSASSGSEGVGAAHASRGPFAQLPGRRDRRLYIEDPVDPSRNLCDVLSGMHEQVLRSCIWNMHCVVAQGPPPPVTAAWAAQEMLAAWAASQHQGGPADGTLHETHTADTWSKKWDSEQGDAYKPRPRRQRKRRSYQ